MTKVSISGYRSLKQIPQKAIDNLNKIMELGFDILIGDCYGIDFLVQKNQK